ncbi:MAG: hypothetical protein QOI02_45, partial [Actinomycetota bacterium]|nr:hypothetical protein [Actinomycetota bacterium]
VSEPCGVQRILDLLHLVLHTCDELRAITGANNQFLRARAKEASFDAQSGTALMFFGVDNKNAGWPDSYVVNVRAAARYTAIVENAEVVAGSTIQSPTKSLFTCGSDCPGLRALRVVGQRKNKPTHDWMMISDARFAPRFPELVLAIRRGTGHSCERLRSWDPYRLRGRGLWSSENASRGDGFVGRRADFGRTCKTDHRPGCAVVTCHRTSGQLCIALAAPSPVTKSQHV